MEYDSTSDNARTRAGGAGAKEANGVGVGTFRAGGGGTALAGDDAMLTGLAGGGAAALPGVVGGGTLRLGVVGGLAVLLREGIEGTGRLTLMDEVGRGGGAGVGRAGGVIVLFGIVGGGRGAAGGDPFRTGRGGALPGGGGAREGGVGTVREGRLGAGRLGGAVGGGA